MNDPQMQPANIPVQTQAPAAQQSQQPDRTSILSQVAQKIGNVASVPFKAVNDAASDAFGATMHVSGQSAPDAGAQFASKFKNIPTSVMGIEPAVTRASKAFGVSPDSLYYTLVSENAPAAENPKGVDPNDQGMFQVNKLNSPLVESTLKKEFGIDYDPSNPQHSAMAAAVVLSDTAKQLQTHGFSNLSPQDLSIAYRMGPTNFSIATRGTDLNGNKARPLQKEAIQKEYKDRLTDLNKNNQDLSTPQVAVNQ